MPDHRINDNNLRRALAALPRGEANPLCSLARNSMGLYKVVRFLASELFRARTEQRELLHQGWIQGYSDALCDYRKLVTDVPAEEVYQRMRRTLHTAITVIDQEEE